MKGQVKVIFELLTQKNRNLLERNFNIKNKTYNNYANQLKHLKE